MEVASRRFDPLLGAIAGRALSSPITAATAYSFLSITTSITAAAFEHRLVDGSDVYWGTKHLVVHPLLSNFSTLLDFALLNPLVILFLMRSRVIVQSIPALNQKDTVADKALRWLASVACAALAAVLMLAYSESFALGKFFDAIVAITDHGQCFITLTGHVVFFWTGLFIYLLLVGAIHQVAYVVRICQLGSKDISYEPLHEDGAAGLRILGKPAVEFTKASLALLAIGVVFWIYDRLLTHAALTNRTASIAVFTAIVFPLFALPIIRLHALMCERREQILRSIRRRVPALDSTTFDHEGGAQVRSIKELADEVEAAENLRTRVLSFPTWPLSRETLVSCGAYFASIAAPALSKALPLVTAAFGFK